MTPREAMAMQLRRPQLPHGWPVPDHPANRCPERHPEPDMPAAMPGKHHERVKQCLRQCAAAGYLPYYDEIRASVGLDSLQLSSALQTLVATGWLQRDVGPTKPHASPEWAAEFDGVTHRTLGARDLEPLAQRRGAPGSVQTKVLNLLKNWRGDLPLQAEMAGRLGIARKSFIDSMQRLQANGLLRYEDVKRGGNLGSLWRVTLDGRILQSREWRDE